MAAPRFFIFSWLNHDNTIDVFCEYFNAWSVLKQISKVGAMLRQGQDFSFSYSCIIVTHDHYLRQAQLPHCIDTTQWHHPQARLSLSLSVYAPLTSPSAPVSYPWCDPQTLFMYGPLIFSPRYYIRIFFLSLFISPPLDVSLKTTCFSGQSMLLCVNHVGDMYNPALWMLRVMLNGTVNRHINWASKKCKGHGNYFECGILFHKQLMSVYRYIHSSSCFKKMENLGPQDTPLQGCNCKKIENLSCAIAWHWAWQAD
jgi:hypothetical protein